MSRIAVTGATGFLGSRLCEILKQSGHEVVGLGRNPKAGVALTAMGVDFRPGDLTDVAYVDRALSGVEVLVHSAALSSPFGRYENFYTANVVTTEIVLGASTKHHISRYIHISTPSIYFDFKDRLNVSEADPLPHPFVNHYATTKYLAEVAVNVAFENGLKTIILRPRGIFGPQDTSVMPRVIKALEDKRFPLFRKGHVKIDLTYVDNVVEAIVRCLDAKPACFGKVYNITNDDPRDIKDIVGVLSTDLSIPFHPKRVPYSLAYSVAWLVEWVHTILNIEPQFTTYTLGLVAFSNTLDISAAKKDLNYSPKISLDQGLSKFTDWWKCK